LRIPHNKVPVQLLYAIAHLCVPIPMYVDMPTLRALYNRREWQERVKDWRLRFMPTPSSSSLSATSFFPLESSELTPNVTDP
jgi:hypothetical protein